jgi:type III pantothenate kinase
VKPTATGGESPARWLLIGNSRWHWATPAANGGEILLRHTAPCREPLGDVAAGLFAWAAVGTVPAGLGLPAGSRLTLAEVPLAKAPPWLGIDRALAGWQAWRRSGGSVLVADAGTVLSFSLVDGSGSFSGGRLMAGVSLQWRAMAAGTVALPPLEAEGELPAGEPWPFATAAAMRSGVVLGLAAAVAEALEAALRRQPDCRLVLTGGDGPLLWEPLQRRLASSGLSGRLEHRPALALEGLASLVPDQLSPRSARI